MKYSKPRLIRIFANTG